MIWKKRISEYSFIRASDVNRDIMYYEVRDKKDRLIMTISPNSEGEYEVYIEKSYRSRVIKLDLLKEVLSRAEACLDEDGDWNDDPWGRKESPDKEA